MSYFLFEFTVKFRSSLCQFWIKFCTIVKHSSVTSVFGAFWSAKNWPWPWPCTTHLASYLLTKWQFWQLSLKWLERALRIKPNNIIAVFFSLFPKVLFDYAIREKFITWLVNSALNCTWKPISHSSLLDSCDIGFRVQFKAEFPLQVMNFCTLVNSQLQIMQSWLCH